MMTNDKEHMIMLWHDLRITGSLWGISTGHHGFHSRKATRAELWWFQNFWPEKPAEQTVELPTIWDTMTLMWHHTNVFMQAPVDIWQQNDTISDLILLRIYFRLVNQYFQTATKWWPILFQIIKGQLFSDVSNFWRSQWRQVPSKL